MIRFMDAERGGKLVMVDIKSNHHVCADAEAVAEMFELFDGDVNGHYGSGMDFATEYGFDSDDGAWKLFKEGRAIYFRHLIDVAREEAKK